MSERSRMWGAAPNRWAPPAPDRAEPTDGRHAFDRDAALTPIFTALRRGGRRRLRPTSPPLRAVPEPVEFDRGDPPTAPIPIVPALHAVDPYPSGGYAAPPVDPYPTGGYPVPAPHATEGYRYPAPPSPNEMTAVWYPSDDPTAWSPVTESGRYSPVTERGRYAPVTDSGRYSPVTDSGGYAPVTDSARYSPVTESGGYAPVTDSARYSPVTESGRYAPVTDTGRHHRRLAPAGW